MLSLGTGSDGECTVTQEERENHFHVMGTTGEGKSRLLLRMLMSDIDRLRSKKEKGPGVCFIDGSEESDTLTNVLGHCEQVGFKRVLIIDPDSQFTFGKITPLNPVHYDKSYLTKSASYLTDAFRVVFSVKDPAKIAYIENYLPAIFKVLSTAGLTLDDLKYFTDIEQVKKRKEILEMATHTHSVGKLNFAYKNVPLFTKEVGSSMRRIETVFNDEGLSLMLAHRKGVDFANLIADRWLILVKVSEMDTLPGRLLSSIIINEIVFALKRLRSNGWRGYEYLYIDEAAKFATSQIAKILDYHRKIGLRLVLSHQDFGQFTENPELAKSIRVNAKTKVAFYISDNEERMKMVRMMYGGELDDRTVSYVLGQLEKQKAVVKLGKSPSDIIKIHDTPIFKPSKKYLESIYASPWYYTLSEITQDQHERFKSKPAKAARPSQAPNGKTVSRDALPGGIKARRASQKGEVRGEQSLPPDNESPRTPQRGGSRKF
jgi:hypothetical protein